MSTILDVYTADQLKDMYRLQIIADAVGITDFNEGSKIKSIVDANSSIISTISMDHKEAIYRAIPVALYQGFGFTKTDALSATGYMRPYRKPALWVKYTGAGTAAEITSTSLLIAAAVTGAPTDAFSFDYATYTQTSDIVTQIDALTNWSATLVSDVSSDTLYQYTAKEAVGATNYLYGDGLDIMLATATAVSILTGYSVTVDDMLVVTTADGTLSAGESGVQILSEVQTTGLLGNLAINAIDTVNGKGYINSVLAGVEHVINDGAFSGGATAETDDERKIRFSESVSSLNAGTKNGIISAIRAISGIRSVGMRTSYPFRGTNAIVVDNGSGALSAALVTSIEKVLYGDPNDLANYPGKNAEGIGYTIIAPTIVDTSISITAYRLQNVNVDLTEIQTDVQTAIEQYVNTRPLGGDVVLSEVVRVGKNANAACYDFRVTSPANNVTIIENEFSKTGAGTTGVITVTMAIVTSI